MPSISTSKKNSEEVKEMSAGYSTHGYWEKLRRIKELEVGERGNEWFDDSSINLDSTDGIWVTLDPRDAIPYLFLAEEHESEAYQKALENPEDYVFGVDLKGAVPVLEDGDGGILYIRKREGEKV
jgi:hypothetical protein